MPAYMASYLGMLGVVQAENRSCARGIRLPMDGWMDGWMGWMLLMVLVSRSLAVFVAGSWLI